LKRDQIFVVLGTILIIVLFFFVPRGEDYDSINLNSSQAKLTIAMNYVENSPQPMVGIKMLKNMLEENPNDLDVIRVLGRFAVKSGQYNKAAARFQSLVEKTKNPIDKVGAYMELGNAFLGSGKKDKAINSFTKAKELTKDQRIIDAVDKNISNIK